MDVDQQRKELKRQRRKQIIALRRLDPIVSVEKSTWYFLIVNSLSQMYYCLKRMGESCREHVGNNFSPVPSEYAHEFLFLRNEMIRLYLHSLDGASASQIRKKRNSWAYRDIDHRIVLVYLQSISKRPLNNL